MNRISMACILFVMILVGGFVGCDSGPAYDRLAGSELSGNLDGLEDGAPFPGRVLFRSNTASFNRAYYAMTVNGDIWVKPNVEQTGNDGPWQKLTLPAGLDGDVTGIAMDGEHIIALNSERQIYTMWNGLDAVSGFRWQVAWGFPFWGGPGMRLRDDILKWDWSVVSPREDENYTDPAGHLFPVGMGKCSHIWLLSLDGQHLTYVDPWLPTDYSYGLATPYRGRFKAVNFSISGSRLFIINANGDMFTRFFDFDIGGIDNLFYQYSYYDQTNKLVPEIQLPSFPWVMQPKINGTITDRISIHKIGKNCIHRTLRVEGTDGAGHTGYYEKDVQPPAQWTFHRTDLPLQGTVLDNRPYDSSLLTLGESEDHYYERNMDDTPSLSDDFPWWRIMIRDWEWTAELLDFNCYDSPAVLRVHLGPAGSIDLLLHTRDRIRLMAREQGLDDNPRLFSGTIEIPRALLDTLASRSLKTRKFVETYLLGRRFVTVDVTATSDTVRVSGTAGGAVIDWKFAEGERLSSGD